VSPRTRTPPDPRHCLFRTLLEAYWRDERNELVPDLPWGPGEAGALGAFLRANPRLSADGFRRLLEHRLNSEDHARGEPPKIWLSSLTRYANGPLNKYKQPKERRNDGNRADERKRDITNATSAALARVRGVAGAGAGPARRLPPE
jgi:hypothetical protein